MYVACVPYHPFHPFYFYFHLKTQLYALSVSWFYYGQILDLGFATEEHTDAMYWPLLHTLQLVPAVTH